ARCHGEMGAGGVSNPGSFKGYIPGFWGDDYSDLVRSDQELHEWIDDGAIPRITEHPIGGWFFRRQAGKMPADGEVLPPGDGGAGGGGARGAWVRGLGGGGGRPGVRCSRRGGRAGGGAAVGAPRPRGRR